MPAKGFGRATVWPQVRVVPGPQFFACSASYGTAGHPVLRGQSRWLNGRKAELVVRDDKLNPGEAATRTLELVEKEKVNFLVGSLSAAVQLAIKTSPKNAASSSIRSASQMPSMKPPLGLVYVPEERRIVQGLSVRENLRLGLVASPEKKREVELIEDIARIFPRLAERLDQEAVTMSGGEQQMLAIARAMIAKPDLIMLDEPSEGIMPVLVDEMFELFRAMKDQGTTVLLVEQNVDLALDIADRAYVLDQGSVVYHAAARDLLADNEIKERYCSV